MILCSKAFRLVLFCLIAFTRVSSAEIISFSASSCKDILTNKNSYRILHSGSKDIEFPVISQKSISGYAPFEQASAILTVNGKPYAYGNRSSMERISQNVDLFKNILFAASLTENQTPTYTVDDKNVQIQVAPSLSGSTPVSHAYSDIDSELLLVASHKDFSPNDFHDANSLTIKAFAKHIQNYMKQISSRGFVFSDFKAGEYDFIPRDAQETKSRSIKWKLQEIIDGKKLIPQGTEDGPKDWITLEEALSSEGRVKADWIVAVDGDQTIKELTGIGKRYVEVSILFILGGRRGNGTPVLKVSSRNVIPPIGASGAHLAEQNRTALLPVRTTTVYFDATQFELAREASVSTPAVDIRFLNNVVLNSIQTHSRHRNMLKALKLLSTRFFYWNDFQYFRAEHPQYETQLQSTSDLKGLIDGIIHQPVVEALSLVKNSAIALKRLNELKVTDSQNQSNLIASLKNVMQKFNLSSTAELSSLDDIIEISTSLLNAHVAKCIDENEIVKSYIAYVLQLDYSKTFDFKESDSSFVSFQLPQSFTDAYARTYTNLVAKYPNVDFTKPEDLHMTIAFMGKMTTKQEVQLKAYVAELQSKLQGAPFVLNDSAIKIIGSKNSQLAVVFDETQMPADVLKAITEFKTKILKLGIRPDSKHDIDGFLPHVSVAYIRGMHFNSDAHFQVSQLLFDNELAQLNHLNLTGRINLQYVKDSEDPNDPRYYSEPIQ